MDEMSNCEEVMESKFTIEDLPDEMMVDIFSYISIEELVNQVQFVCRRWKDLSHSTRLWKDFEFAPTSKYSTKEITELLSKMRSLKSFTFHQAHDVETISTALSTYCKELKRINVIAVDRFPTKEFAELCKKLPELESLCISPINLTNKVIIEAIQKCPNLTELKCTWIHGHAQTHRSEINDVLHIDKFNIPTLTHLEAYIVCASPLIEMLLEHNADNLTSLKFAGLYQELMLQISKCSKLEVLSLNLLSRPCNVKTLFSDIGKLQYLKSLSMKLFVDSDKSSLCSLFAYDNLPKLTELDLNHCMNFSKEVAISLVRCCPNLQVLNLKACVDFKDEHLQTLVRCRELRSLDISGCKWLTEKSLSLIPALHYLHTLTYTWIPAITTLMFEALSGSNSLRKVYLDHCGVTQADVIGFASNSPNLAYLSLYGCCDLDPTHLQQSIRSVRLLFHSRLRS